MNPPDGMRRGGKKTNPNPKSGKLRKAEQMLRCSFVYFLRFEEDFFFFFFLNAFLS